MGRVGARAPCTNVGVVEAGQHLGFALESGESIRVNREGLMEDFQRNIAAELRALADEGGDVVVPEAVTDGQGHELCL